jgi:hypothetical protein
MARIVSTGSGPNPITACARLALLTLLIVAALPAGAAGGYTGPIVSGQLAEPANQETSGLAASPRTPGLLWAHDDSGGHPVLFAMRPNGSLIGRLQVTGEVNRDWEDIASFEADGQAWLLIADIGDNRAVHAQSVLHVLAEPDADTLQANREVAIPPAYSLHFAYEDGPRDCESVAVDARERAVYLLSKRDATPRLYRLDLGAAPADKPAIARLVGLVPHLPRSESGAGLSGGVPRKWRGQPTAMDFAADGSAALVLTYGRLLFFPRRPGQTWAEALAAEPEPLPAFDLPQAESACFADGGRTIYLASENTQQLLRFSREQ